MYQNPKALGPRPRHVLVTKEPSDYLLCNVCLSGANFTSIANDPRVVLLALN